ncbi:unnamed protein product [Cylicocyclus nassatus]|uniref:Uncharacterized protein n=1 Tax=Cylicocyclus nassatus TaxID=53992 RepID=A0AA36M9X8_CYLNA|nr:unnamed protein product [Cylicocyclus nassatus]
MLKKILISNNLQRFDPRWMLRQKRKGCWSCRRSVGQSGRSPSEAMTLWNSQKRSCSAETDGIIKHMQKNRRI